MMFTHLTSRISPAFWAPLVLVVASVPAATAMLAPAPVAASADEQETQQAADAATAAERTEQGHARQARQHLLAVADAIRGDEFPFAEFGSFETWYMDVDWHDHESGSALFTMRSLTNPARQIYEVVRRHTSVEGGQVRVTLPRGRQEVWSHFPAGGSILVRNWLYWRVSETLPGRRTLTLQTDLRDVNCAGKGSANDCYGHVLGQLEGRGGRDRLSTMVSTQMQSALQAHATAACEQAVANPEVLRALVLEHQPDDDTVRRAYGAAADRFLGEIALVARSGASRLCSDTTGVLHDAARTAASNATSQATAPAAAPVAATAVEIGGWFSVEPEQEKAQHAELQAKEQHAELEGTFGLLLDRINDLPERECGLTVSWSTYADRLGDILAQADDAPDPAAASARRRAMRALQDLDRIVQQAARDSEDVCQDADELAELERQDQQRLDRVRERLGRVVRDICPGDTQRARLTGLVLKHRPADPHLQAIYDDVAVDLLDHLGKLHRAEALCSNTTPSTVRDLPAFVVDRHAPYRDPVELKIRRNHVIRLQRQRALDTAAQHWLATYDVPEVGATPDQTTAALPAEH